MRFKKPRSATMKGYGEEHGWTFKLEFDAETKQFGSKSVAHAFVPKTASNAVVQKLAELRKRGQRKRAQRNLAKTLANMTPEARDDLGMTEVFAAFGGS
jgi:lauroyl/myristoyl acyltransferase